MAAIRCQWGHVHATVAEVRACAAGREPDRGPDPEWDYDDGGEPDGEREPVAERAPDRVPAASAAGGDPASWAGPDWLGRDAIVAPGQAVPEPWAAAPAVAVADLRADPAGALASLWERRHARRRTVFVLEGDPPPPVVLTGPAWRHPPDLLLADDVLTHLVTSNAVDLRPGRAPWPWADRAVAAGADLGGPADVVLPDGTPAWCDGGPPTPFVARDGVAVVPRVALERGRLTSAGGAGRADAELAPDQAAAVHHEGGAARVIAPAGSGKTRVLTARARHLLTGWNVPPSALCLVAFNTRAADEIRQRTTDLSGLHVRTLNALGLAILDGTPPFAARTRSRRSDVLAETAVRALLDTLVTPVRAAGTDPIATWIAALGDVRLRLRDPAVVEADYGGDVDGLPEVVDRYRRALADRGAVDFDEQIIGAIELLLRDPDVRASAQRACRFLLVDEFQDLAPAHLLLLRLVAAPELSVFGVGDDDQTIYGFSGATPEWLIGYDRLFPGAGHHPLDGQLPVPARRGGGHRPAPGPQRPAGGQGDPPGGWYPGPHGAPRRRCHRGHGRERGRRRSATGAEPADVVVLGPRGLGAARPAGGAPPPGHPRRPGRRPAPGCSAPASGRRWRGSASPVPRGAWPPPTWPRRRGDRRRGGHARSSGGSPSRPTCAACAPSRGGSRPTAIAPR